MHSFPEELVERILSLCVSPPSLPPPRPSWHPVPSPALPARSRIAPLLVCKSWARIALPLFYHTLHLRTPAQAAILPASPYAHSVRSLVLHGSWPAHLHAIARACPRLALLDITLDAGSEPHDASLWPESLHAMDIQHLILRKANNAYLSQPKPRAVLAHLAQAIPHWPRLCTVHVDFKLSDDASGTAHAFATALAHAPRLATVLTQLPAVWNPVLLTLSANPRLERIVLNPQGDVVLGTGLFLMEARKHAKLVDLIRAGTPIIRTRAHTMGTVHMSATLPPAASCPPPLSEELECTKQAVPVWPAPAAAVVARRWEL